VADEALAHSLELTAKELLPNAPEGWMSGDDLARALDVGPEDLRLPDAWREVQKRGVLRVEGWPDDGKGNPQRISL